MNNEITLKRYQQQIDKGYRRFGILLIVLFVSIITIQSSVAQTPALTATTKIDKSESQMTARINSTRAKGCKCGRKYYRSVDPVKWSKKLKLSSQDYAAQMHRYKRFDHNGIDGSVVGDRVDAVGYFWQLAGENIGEGYNTFEEVYRAWLASPSHCELIMNGRMKDLAVSRQGKYWVLHMGLHMPPGTDRSNVRYH